MNSYELVKAAINGERPQRLPVRMASLGVDDTVWVPLRSKRTEENGVVKDEWGCLWQKTEMHNMGQVKGHPLSSLSRLEDLVIPDYTRDEIYAEAEKALDNAEKTGKYTQMGIFMVLFERMHSLAGFENILMGLYTERRQVEILADRILEAQLTLVKQAQERMGNRLHSFSMTDDWGTQQAAFISIELWNEFFLPRYRRLFAQMHEGGQDVWVHSCGKINEIIEGFIAAGADVINLQQPRALGIEEIGQRYRGRITFESLADIQATLPTHDVKKIEADAQALGRHWMSPEGGFIFSDYGDGEAIGVPLVYKQAMYEVFSRVSESVYGKPLPPLP